MVGAAIGSRSLDRRRRSTPVNNQQHDTENQSDETRFDWYAATVAMAVTAPFAIWALLVITEQFKLESHLAIAIGASVVFMAFVFWAFGTIKIK
jgi:glucuronate isomerase